MILQESGKSLLKTFDYYSNKIAHTPPLREFFVECIRYPDFAIPPKLLIVNPRYALLADDAFKNQSLLGWSNFNQGFISIRWKKIQYKYLLELNHGDIYAVDKWSHMLTKNVLEFSRLMWNERCTIVAAEKEATYDGRKRRQMWILRSYLQRQL